MVLLEQQNVVAVSTYDGRVKLIDIRDFRQSFANLNVKQKILQNLNFFLNQKENFFQVAQSGCA